MLIVGKLQTFCQAQHALLSEAEESYSGQSCPITVCVFMSASRLLGFIFIQGNTLFRKLIILYGILQKSTLNWPNTVLHDFETDIM